MVVKTISVGQMATVLGRTLTAIWEYIARDQVSFRTMLEN